LINRAGEKISPAEVDAVLLSHPAIAMAASFGVPDPIYGEEIHAAVVPRTDVTAAELQALMQEPTLCLRDPNVIHFVNELPESSTGKVDRHRLSELFSS